MALVKPKASPLHPMNGKINTSSLTFFDLPREIRDKIFFQFLAGQRYTRSSALISIKFIAANGQLHLLSLDPAEYKKPGWPDASIVRTSRRFADEYLDAYFHTIELLVDGEGIGPIAESHFNSWEYFGNVQAETLICVPLKCQDDPVCPINSIPNSGKSSPAKKSDTFNCINLPMYDLLRRVHVVKLREWEDPMLPVAFWGMPNLSKVSINVAVTVYRDLKLRGGRTKEIPICYNATLEYYPHNLGKGYEFGEPSRFANTLRSDVRFDDAYLESDGNMGHNYVVHLIKQYKKDICTLENAREVKGLADDSDGLTWMDMRFSANLDPRYMT